MHEQKSMLIGFVIVIQYAGILKLNLYFPMKLLKKCACLFQYFANHESVHSVSRTNSIIPVLQSEFLGLENTSYRKQLKVLSVNSFEKIHI